MNNEGIEKVAKLMIVITLCLVAFFAIRGAIIAPSQDGLCEYQYGENYIHNIKSEFGRYCIKLNYETLTKEDAKPYNWTNSEVREICQTPGFLELNKWKGENC